MLAVAQEGGFGATNQREQAANREAHVAGMHTK